MSSILLIEDSEAQRAEVRRVLEASGDFERILEAGDGLEGLRVLLAEQVDVVLCDLAMPGIDGEKLLCAKAGREGHSEVPFLFLTASEDQERKARLLRQGASDVIAKPFHAADLLARVQLHLRIRRLQDELRQQNHILERLSMTDSVTGLRTRRYVTEMLSIETLRAARYRVPIAVWMADIDHFKRINDRHGHPAGDAVLRSCADLMRQILRATDVAGRYGGDEFLVLLPQTDRKGALAAAERLRASVEHATFEPVRGAPVRVTVSLGVAAVGPGVDSPVNLIEAADEALYRAKQAGRNRVAAARFAKRSAG
jgi:diguanylate cyclase (GGDEF)-like protein